MTRTKHANKSQLALIAETSFQNHFFNPFANLHNAARALST
jgi:hypothetical protein